MAAKQAVTEESSAPAEDDFPSAAPPFSGLTSFLRALIKVPKAEIDRLEAERPKKSKRKKPDAA